MSAGMNLNFPFTITPFGRVETCDSATHVEQLIEQVLFTRLGERVNRPDLGVGIEDMVFEAVNAQVLSVIQLSVESQLLRWVGDLVRFDHIQVSGEGATLIVEIAYRLPDDPTPRSVTLSR